MPIRYPEPPQFQAPNFNFLGAMAQGEVSGVNELRRRALENELAQQEGVKNVLTSGRFDINSPASINALVNAGALDDAIKLMGAQRAAAVARAQQENYLNEILLRGKTFDANLPNVRAMTREHLANANKAQLDLFQNRTSAAQDLISRTSAETWDEDRANIIKLDPTLRPPPQFDPGWNDRALRTAKTMQDVAVDVAKKRAEARIPKVIAPTPELPGMVVGPRGVSKIPEVPLEEQATDIAPAAEQPQMKGRLINDIQLPKEVMDLQKTMAIEENIKRTAPLGREKEALGKYRFSNTLKNIGSTFIDLAKAKGIAVPGESPQETFQALANKSRFGEFFGKLNAPERVALVDALRSQVNTAVPQLASAAGLQSKNFDSNAEGERLRAALADPDNVANISSAFRILNDLNTNFGSGAPLFETGKEEEKIIRERRGLPSPASTLEPDVAKKVNDIWGIR